MAGVKGAICSGAEEQEDTLGGKKRNNGQRKALSVVIGLRRLKEVNPTS